MGWTDGVGLSTHECLQRTPLDLISGASLLMTPTRIAIIGGGPGGLLTAYLLQRRASHPFEATIFESTSRLGGKISSPRFSAAPVSYEAGAAELYDYSD